MVLYPCQKSDEVVESLGKENIMLNEHVCNALNDYTSRFEERRINSDQATFDNSSIAKVSSLPWVYREWVMSKFKVTADMHIDKNMLYYILDMPVPLREAISISLEYVANPTFNTGHKYESVFNFFIDSESNKAPNVLIYPITKKEIIKNGFTSEKVMANITADYENATEDTIFYCIKLNNSKVKSACFTLRFRDAGIFMADMLRTDFRQR